MSPFEILSEFVIEILKEFAIEKRKLTPDTLSDALSRKEKVASLLAAVQSTGGGTVKKENVSLSCEVSDDETPKTEDPPEQPAPPLFKQVNGIYAKLLLELEPLSKGMNAQLLTALRERVQNCRDQGEIAANGEDIVSVTKVLITRVVQETQYANDFLSELGKDLTGVEKELDLYQDHRRETNLLNDKFHSNLLTHTEEMNKAVAMEEFEDNSIASKLTSIVKTVMKKRQEDEVRIREADSKIAELQKSIRKSNSAINEATQRANALEKEVLVDALTQINNRRAYELEMRDTFNRFQRDGQPFSLILIDVDHFKKVNDDYGHRAGDKCLERIAKKVQSSIRRTDFLARYGGEELIAILHGAHAEDALQVAEKIRSRIEQTRFRYLETEIPVTISLGVTEVLPKDPDAEAPFLRTDEALYKAKREGRNRVCRA